MPDLAEFQGFPKISRLNRDMVVTEKLDGTSAQIAIERIHSGDDRWTNENDFIMKNDPTVVAVLYVPAPDEAFDHRYILRAGSRKRWVVPGDDNYGFAAWVRDNGHHLVALGEGRHYGEWWGAGIQRRYDQSEKHFSLFNTARWNAENVPGCCSVVPVLYEGPFDTNKVREIVDGLRATGSVAAPGYMNPEGVVVFHTALNAPLKVTCLNDDKPKGKNADK